MSNSPLICYTKISPNRNSPRKGTIKGIAIHCMAGQLSVETCGNVFAPSSRQASSNYGIGPDGRIGMYVEEKDRSWCTSTSLDNFVVTIEVASDNHAPYTVTNAAYYALIDLCVDICQRNGIKALKWQANASLAGQWDKQNMLAHRWFNKAKSCPGDYLYERFGQIAAAVNVRLGDGGNKTYCGTGIGEGTAKEDMAVRDASNTKGLKIGTVPKGAKVEILQQLSNKWLKIVWPGSPKGYGYTSNAGGGYYDVKLYSKGPSKTPKWVGRVNTGLLNVRSEPKVSNPPSANVIMQLGYMNQVDVCDERDGWYYIRIVDKYGWVSKVYITR